MPLRYHNNPDDTFMRDLRPSRILALERQPSCLAFNPQWRNMFVIGTYALEGSEGAKGINEIPFALGDDEDWTEGDITLTAEQEEEVKRAKIDRVGTLDLFPFLDGDIPEPPRVVRCRAAVMDLQWNPHRPDLLGCGLADGTVAVYYLSHGRGSRTGFCLSNRCRVAMPSVVVTAVCWHPTDDTMLGVATTEGRMELMRLTRRTDSAGYVLEHIETMCHHHDVEAWCLAISPMGGVKFGLEGSGSFVLHTGGDDARILTHPFPQDETLEDEREINEPPPIRVGHRAGVTAMLLLPPSAAPGEHHLLLTGSYDEHVRVINAIDPEVVVKEHLGGGVWDLKLFRDHTDLPHVRSGGWKAFCGPVRGSITTDDVIDFKSPDGFEKNASIQAGGLPVATVTPSEITPQGRRLVLDTPESAERIEFLVLASCMHAGAKILRISRRPWGEENICRDNDFGEDEHQLPRGNVAINIVASLRDDLKLEGICYAADAQPPTERDKHRLDVKQYVVTTTFYEKQLAIWEFADTHRPQPPDPKHGPPEPYPAETEFEREFTPDANPLTTSHLSREIPVGGVVGTEGAELAQLASDTTSEEP